MPNHRPAVTIVLAALTATIAVFSLLRHFLPRESAANVEAGLIVGAVVVVVFGVGFLRKRGS